MCLVRWNHGDVAKLGAMLRRISRSSGKPMYIMMTAFIESDGLYKASNTETLYLASFARECLLEIIVIDMVIFLRMVFASSNLDGYHLA